MRGIVLTRIIFTSSVQADVSRSRDCKFTRSVHNIFFLRGRGWAKAKNNRLRWKRGS